MRVFIAISIVVASVSSSSAQFAMDHGHAADAKAAAIANGAPLTPSQQTNFYVNSGGTVKIVLRTAVELKADEAAARDAWNERCRPTVVEDGDGLRRVKYAERDCDLSRFNTAGN
jgi:hypothetical protein